MRPVVFSDTIGWLHPAAGSRGVVIAGAHGLDDLCSRRFLTMMARRMAAAGLPVLQFDYPGCGDAAGDHDAPGRVPAWTASIGEAIDRLKRETGVDDVLLVGFRLGAMLAPEAVAARADVAALALLAPPPSGKAYIRELTGLSRMIDATLPAQADTIDGLPFDGLQAAGFRMTAQTVAALRALEWTDTLAATPVGDLLVMPAAPSPKLSRLVEDLGQGGRRTRLEPFTGYAMLMCELSASEIPQGVLASVVAWARERAGRARGDGPPAPLPASLSGPHWEERPVVIAGGPEICGVLCVPTGRPAPREVSLFLNAGAVAHVGWARGTVEAARALAAAGGASLRIDLPGVGQSNSTDEKPAFLYDQGLSAEIVRVVDWLEGAGFRGVCAIGTCSGAFQAFHAARRDPRIAQIAMVNPLCFRWNSSYALDIGVWKAYESTKVALKLKKVGDEPGDEPAAPAPRGGPAAPGRPSLRSTLSGIAPRLIMRSLAWQKWCMAKLSLTGLLFGRPVERWMADLTGRGTRVLVVSADGDLSIEEIARHFGPGGERLKRMPGVTMRRIAACDHTLTPPHARRALDACLVQFTRPTPPRPTGEAEPNARRVETLRASPDGA